MKKLFALILVLCLMLPLLVSCNGGDGGDVITSLPEWMNGKDALRLMLANERLDVTQLKDAENIFATGAEVLENLETMSVESLAQYDYAAPLGVKPIVDKRVTATDGSVLEIDGQIYKFKSFAEYSNSYDYFKNLTNGVASTAEQGAELIDNVKKYVRAVDVWVAQGHIQYYLHVEENSETLISRYVDGSTFTQYEICRRTKGEDGLNIYEIYIGNDIGETVMTYIPGRKCEYSHRSIATDFDHNFLAENTKGYWEVVDINKAPQHYNVSCMVIKDDICYDAMYNPTAVRDYDGRVEKIEGYISMLKVISSDRKTDIMNIMQYTDSTDITVALQAFSGYSHIEYSADSVSFDGSVCEPNDYGTVVLNNGMRLSDGMQLLDGKVDVGRVFVRHQHKEDDLDGYVPELELSIRAEDGETWQDVFREFLSLTGLSCTRDMRQVEAGIAQAYRELESFTKYHKWNNNLIVSEDTLAEGYKILDARFKASAAIYTAVKDTEVIDYSNRDKIELRIPFAPITAMTATSVTAEGLYVMVEDISLTVEDTMLFVVGEPYAVHFAMVGVGSSNQGLVHIPYENAREFVYSGEDSFTVTGSADFDIPFLDVGEYTLVAYISTADGIRTSAYRAVDVDSVVFEKWSDENISALAQRTANGELHVTYAENPDIYVPLDQTVFASYETMMEAFREAAYDYGYIDDGTAPELQGENGEWIAVTDPSAPLAYGTWRVKYVIRNGTAVREGYIRSQYLTPGGE
ncbi:MAG: hypothetical protein IJ009_00205 [Clostridia bacterium]|nr:hypothetical protein [Clostridia bacterium]